MLIIVRYRIISPAIILSWFCCTCLLGSSTEVLSRARELVTICALGTRIQVEFFHIGIIMISLTPGIISFKCLTTLTFDPNPDMQS